MTKPIDIAKARAETRHCEEIMHFNNAGASLMPIKVSDVLHNFLESEERVGGYETAEREWLILDHFYRSVGKLLNCDPNEVAFVENATRAWDMAFYSLKFSPGDRILTTFSEYGSNVIAYLQQCRRYDISVDFVPNDEYGQIDVRALENMIDDRVKLISMSHIPTGNGLVNPAQAVGKVAKSAGVMYLLDSCQGVGHVPLDVEAIGCDLLAGTGRKYLRGPRGTGFLYVSERIIDSIEPILLDQHAARLTGPDHYEIRSDAKRFENWEQFFAGKAALSTAIDYALEWGVENIECRIMDLATQLRTALDSLEGVRVVDFGQRKCGIVTFDVSPISAGRVKVFLAQKGINVAISSGDGNLVLFEQAGLKEVVRASVHYFNTEVEIDRFISAVDECLKIDS